MARRGESWDAAGTGKKDPPPLPVVHFQLPAPQPSNPNTADGYNDVADDASMGWARYAHSMRVFVLNSGLFYIRCVPPAAASAGRLAGQGRPDLSMGPHTALVLYELLPCNNFGCGHPGPPPPVYGLTLHLLI